MREFGADKALGITNRNKPPKRGGGGGCLSGKPKSRMEETNQKQVFFSSRKRAKKEGYLLKKGKKLGQWKRRYFFLKDDVLYYYRGTDDKLPSGMVYLQGCFCEKITAEEKHGISISNDYKGYVEMRVFAEQEHERDEWFEQIQDAAQHGDVEKQYRFEKEIGHGKFSKVYRAVNVHTDEPVAIKIIQKEEILASEREYLRTELAIIKLLNHPYIAELKEVYEDMKRIYIVLEFVEGGELFDYLSEKKVLPEAEAALVAYQMLQALLYLHQCGIMHRDLKPENILVIKNPRFDRIEFIKITDFGLSKMILPNELCYEGVGTPSYVAPEVLVNRGYRESVDLWSTGIVLYLLLSGTLAFDSESTREIYQMTVDCRISFKGPEWAGVSSEAKDLLGKILQFDPKDRPSVEEALEHPFFSLYLDFGDAVPDVNLLRHEEAM